MTCTHDMHACAELWTVHITPWLREYETAVHLYKCGCTMQRHMHTSHVYAGCVQPDTNTYNNACIRLYAHRVIPTDTLNSESKRHVYHEHKYTENGSIGDTHDFTPHTQVYTNCTYKARSIHAVCVYTARRSRLVKYRTQIDATIASKYNHISTTLQRLM